MYTVKQLADLAGISVRTLHHYDKIALLTPSSVGTNGYRYYTDDEVLRLQQILFFRELDFSLSDIRIMLDQPTFDRVAALQAHRAALQAKIKRLHALIQTIDSTIHHTTGAITMSDKKLFAGFTAEEEERYRQEAREKYGAEQVDASYKRWNNYSKAKQDAIKAEGGAIYTDMVSAIEAGHNTDNPEVQQIVARWHQHLRYFYEPKVEILRDLSHLYVDSPDFAERFRAMHPELPEYLRAAITHYCAGLDADADA